MLPIFPLDLVIFPGMPVPLYVFEERYKRLVRHCLEQDEPRFVIALVDSEPGIHEERPPVREVGSFVSVLQSSENADGTYRMLGHGQGRCRIEIARTEWIPERDGNARPLHFTEALEHPLERGDPNAERLAAWDTLDAFRRYADVFFAFEAQRQIDDALPDDLLYQASFICANVRVENAERQRLLEAPSLIDRFRRCRELIDERLAAHRPLEGDPAGETDGAAGGAGGSDEAADGAARSGPDTADDAGDDPVDTERDESLLN